MSGLDNTSYTVRTSTTAGDALGPTDSILIMTNTGAKALALASAANSIPGRQYTIINAATGAITITPAAGTIDGAATYVVPASLGRVTIVNDGANWFSISEVVV